MTRSITDPSEPVLVVSDAAVEAGARALDALWHTKSGYEVPADSWETADASWRESRLDESRAALTAALPLLAAAPSATREPNDGPGPDGRHVISGECFACLVGVATGPESHADDCPCSTITPRTDR